MFVYGKPINDDDIIIEVPEIKSPSSTMYGTLSPVLESVSSPPYEDLLEIIRSETPYTKSSEEKLSLEIDQDASNFEELLLSC